MIGKAGNEYSTILNTEESETSLDTTFIADSSRFELTDPDEVEAAIAKRRDKIQPVLDYLKDK